MKLCLVVSRALALLPLAALAVSSTGCSKRDISVRVEDYDIKRDVCSSTVSFSAQVQKGQARPNKDEAKPVASKLVPHPTMSALCTYQLSLPAMADDEWISIFVSEEEYATGQRSWPRAMVDSVVEGGNTNPPTFSIVRRDRSGR